MDMPEGSTSPGVLLRALQEVPGLRKLKEEHVTVLSWKVKERLLAFNRACSIYHIDASNSMRQHTCGSVILS